MKKKWVFILLLVITQFAFADQLKWNKVNNLEKCDNGYKVTGPGAWLMSDGISPAVGADECYMVIEAAAPATVPMQFLWWNGDVNFQQSRVMIFNLPATTVIDLGKKGTFDGLTGFQFVPLNASVGTEFDIKSVKFVTREEIQPELLSAICEFKCFASKTCYQIGEQIRYRLTLLARNYPERKSSKIAEVTLLDDKGVAIAKDHQHFGLLELCQLKELYGSIELATPLAPGRYTLQAVLTDQKSGLELKNSYIFTVLGEKDHFVYETPLKFIQDFSIVQGPRGRWHIFSITGDPLAFRDWGPGGNHRTFSHGSSADLRNWTYHKPALTISDDTYPDGNGKYKDRNVWAPHVVCHDGTYYMFYTSVNEYVSQSISLATSKDLFTWKEYEKNPVFTLEDVSWATWGRDHWSDCRDPAILFDNGRFYLYATATAASGNSRGIVTVAISDDLIHWRNTQIAIRGFGTLESPQVWKQNDYYYMTTSSTGYAAWRSLDPVTGWEKVEFPRIGELEEVVRLKDGSLLSASIKGDQIHISKVLIDNQGKPIGHESPFILP